MLRKTRYRALVMVWLSMSSSSGAEEHIHPSLEPLHYTVRFGAIIGELEPVAGEMLCVVNKDCVVLLSLMPKIEIRLRADAGDTRSGRAYIDCESISCGFVNGSRSISYGSKFNDLRIYEAEDMSGSIITPLVWRSMRSLGTFSFAIKL